MCACMPTLLRGVPDTVLVVAVALLSGSMCLPEFMQGLSLYAHKEVGATQCPFWLRLCALVRQCFKSLVHIALGLKLLIFSLHQRLY